MIMNTQKLQVELRLTTRRIVNFTERNKGKNLGDIYFKSSNNCNEKFLAEFILMFGELEEKSPFNGDINRVYDFIDDYKKENNKTYEQIYIEIAEVINDEGFFSKKMTKEELKQLMNNPMSSINLEDTMREVVNKVATEVATEEFKGYKG